MAPRSISVTGREIVGIDLLRFICALSVMFSHFLLSFGGNYEWFGSGAAGVFVFFMISGFIIPYTAENRTSFAFIRSRIVRLVPGVWICASISLLAMYFTLNSQERVGLLGRYFRSIMFIPAVPWQITSLGDIWIAAPYWTLFVEISFYTLVLLLIMFNQFKRISLVATALGSITLIYWLTYFSSVYIFPDSHISQVIARSDYWRVLDLTLVHYGAWFGLGINLWLLGKNSATHGLWSTTVCAAGSLLSVVHSAWTQHSSLLIEAAFCVGGFTVIAAAIWKNNSQNYSISFRIVARWIGLITYPLYLLHAPVGRALISVGLSLHLSMMAATWGSIGLTILLIAVIARRSAEPILQRGMGSCMNLLGNRIKDQGKFSFLFHQPTSS